MRSADDSIVDLPEPADSQRAAVEPVGVADDPSTVLAPRPEHRSDNRQSTGVADLDRVLGGGIPPGRIVALTGPADTPRELLLQHLASAHDRLYLSTLRPQWEIEETIRGFVQQRSRSDESRNDVRVKYLDFDDRLGETRRHVDEIDEPSIVVIDSTDELGTASDADYLESVNYPEPRLRATDSIGVMNCVQQETRTRNRQTPLRLADAIWELRRSVKPGPRRIPPRGPEVSWRSSVGGTSRVRTDRRGQHRHEPRYRVNGWGVCSRTMTGLLFEYRLPRGQERVGIFHGNLPISHGRCTANSRMLSVNARRGKRGQRLVPIRGGLLNRW